MVFEVAVQLDRVGATFFVGETITGAVVVKTDSSTSCKSITLSVRGAVDAKLLGGRTTAGVFERLHEDLRPHVMLALSIPLGGAGSLKIPAGTTELPFSFPLVSTAASATGAPLPLLETYNGVFVSCRYEVKATVAFTLSTQHSAPVELFVVNPGQAELDVLKLDAGSPGLSFEFTSATTKRSRRAGEAVMPEFHFQGSIDRVHIDIDTALSGFVRVVRSSVPITSVEIQLARSECCASEARQDRGREITEVQNIQIGDGDVLRDWDIPIFMRFPRWYTCPAIRTPQLRVEFEISVVITFETRVQVSQMIPIRLYRSAKKIS
jgi:hypothetical protein